MGGGIDFVWEEAEVLYGRRLRFYGRRLRFYMGGG